LRYYIAKYSLKKADIITSDSYYMSDIIGEKFGVNKDIILTFPFGLENIKKTKYKKENIIFSNRALYPNYNIDIILIWFSQQPKNYKLVIANKGSLEGYLRKLAKNLKIEDRVIFTGYLSPEKQNYFYAISKFYISIPNSDSTSVSLLEAMHYGCIPIVSNIPANREWILDGINGIFFNKNLKLDKIKICKSYYEINLRLLKEKAHFSKSIKKLVDFIKSTSKPLEENIG